MKTTLALAAAIMLGAAGTAVADTVSYTFGDDSGAPLCDGLQLDEESGVATGTHVGGSQCDVGDYAGGLEAHVIGIRHHVWVITTTDRQNVPHTVETYVINDRENTWQVYEVDTVDDVPFQLINSGVLLTGTPPHRPTAHRSDQRP
jgi:hypothetical protein